MSASNVIALIHGYGFDSRIWDPVEIAFDGFQVIKFSLPGFGIGAPHGPYTIESLAKTYWHALDEQNILAVHLVGHSMGGYVCMEMIAQQPERVTSLALVHSHVFEDPAEKKKARSATLEEINSSGKEAFARKMIGSMTFDKEATKKVLDILIQRGLSYSDEAWYNGTQAIRDRSDHSHTISQYRHPVLLLMGEEDTAVSVELAYKQSAIVPHGKLVVLKGVGHLSMYEDTLSVIRELATFYRDQD